MKRFGDLSRFSTEHLRLLVQTADELLRLARREGDRTTVRAMRRLGVRAREVLKLKTSKALGSAQGDA